MLDKETLSVSDIVLSQKEINNLIIDNNIMLKHIIGKMKNE